MLCVDLVSVVGVGFRSVRLCVFVVVVCVV